VRDQQHAGAAGGAVAVDEVDDVALIGQVETGQRLVAQQQTGLVGERLSHAQRCCSPPESSPTGRSAKAAAPTASISVCDRGRRGAAPGSRSGARRRRDARGRGRASPCAGQRALLRDVADATVPGPAHGLAERLDRARTEALEAEDGAKKRGLAGTTGPEHRDQLARLQLEVEAAPQLWPLRESAAAMMRRKREAGVTNPARS
jgi:hypothetical protein